LRKRYLVSPKKAARKKAAEYDRFDNLSFDKKTKLRFSNIYMPMFLKNKH